MHTATHRGRRAIALAAALLLALPLLLTNPSGAQAQDDPSYETRWNSQGGHDWGTERGTTTEQRNAWLHRTVDPGDGTLTGVEETFSISPGSAADLQDCEADAFEGEITAETASVCEFTIDFPEGPDGYVTVTSTLTADGDVEIVSEVTYIRATQTTELSIDGTPVTPPIEVSPGDDDLVLDVVVENTGAVDLDMMSVWFRNDGFGDLVADCDPHQPEGLPYGETFELTCTFGEITQWTGTTLRVQTRPSEPLDGIIRVSSNFDDFLDLVLDPSATISAEAEPTTVYDGEGSDVTVTVENTGDVVFSEVATDVRVDGAVACVLTSPDELAVGASVDLGPCYVSPEPGEAVTVGATDLPYAVYEDTGLFGLDPIDVDLTAQASGLTVDAEYGGVWGPGDDFTARDRFPIGGGSGFLAEPVLQVTVANTGTVDLDTVELTSDLAGCATTLSIDAGDAEVVHCDGPDATANDPQVTTTVDASAQIPDGPLVEASDTAGFTAFGIEVDAKVDPDWDGLGVEVPYLVTLTNIGGLDLEAAHTQPTAAATVDCAVAVAGGLPIGESATLDDCTLLAGDLVDGLQLLAIGSESVIAEGPAQSADWIELQLDPWGLVDGTAEIDGDALAGVEVELRLIELLELPQAEIPEPMALGAAIAATTAAGTSDCTTVGELTGADEGGIVAATVSDDQGGFCFDEVPPGDYELIVTPIEDAELDDITVDGRSGFTTNSPATSEPFFVGFASASLGAPVDAQLVFAGIEEDAAVEPIDDTTEDEEELPDTGASTLSLFAMALLAILFGAAMLPLAGRRRRTARSKAAITDRW